MNARYGNGSDLARKEMIKALSAQDFDPIIMNMLQREALIREAAVVRANIHRPLDERGTQSQKEIPIHEVDRILIKPDGRESNPIEGELRSHRLWSRLHSS